MRTKVIRRLATGTCSVCLCYGLVVQALNGEMSAEAVTPELLTASPTLTAEPTQTPGLPAYVIEVTPAPAQEPTPSSSQGKRRVKHAQERWTQPVESAPVPEAEAPAEETDEEKKRAPEEDGENEENSDQQQSSDGDPPTLSQFLSALRCGGCRHNCSLLSPRCMRGRSKQQAATVEYTQTYGV